MLKVQVIEDFTQAPVKAEDVRIEHNQYGSTSATGISEDLERISDSNDDLSFYRCYLDSKPQYDGSLALMKFAERSGDQYKIVSTKAGYRLFLAAREFLKGNIRPESREYVGGRLNFAGVGGALMLDGGDVAYTVRRHDVQFPGMINVPACGMMQYDDREKRMPQPAEAFYQKASDKLGLSKSDFESVYPLVFAKSLQHTQNPHLTFAGRLSIGFKSFEDRFDEAVKKKAWEDAGVGSFPIDKAGDFLEENWGLTTDLFQPSVMYLVKSEAGNKAFSELESRLKDMVSLEPTDALSKASFMAKKLSGI